MFNFRDLGGYATADGRTTRWRTLFRADGLDRLTPADVEVLRPYGLRTVVDLRMAHEFEERGRFPVDSYPVTFHNISVLDQTWDREQALASTLPAADFLHERYTEMLAEAGPRYADALRLLAAADALPAVFHCAAGKDRTGLLAMLVLGAVGVGHDDIVEDYALTSTTMAAFRAAAAEQAESAEALAEIPQLFWSADPLAMSRVLADIERDARLGRRVRPCDRAHATASSPPWPTTCSPPDLLTAFAPDRCEDGGMCRNITILRGLQPAATAEEIEAAARQYVRKVSGVQTVSAANEASFELAVRRVTDATTELLATLPPRKQPPTTVPPLRRIRAQRPAARTA